MSGAATKILFLGWRDACRSRMAALLAPTILGDGIVAFSAGLAPAAARPCTGPVMAELGLTADEGPGRGLHDLPNDGFDLVVTLDRRAQAARLRSEDLEDEQRRILYGGVPIHLHWPIADPFSGGDEADREDACRAARDMIAFQLRALHDQGTLTALLHERRRLTRFADLLHEGVLIHDEYRRIFLVNDAFLRIIGRRRDEVIGHDCHEVFDGQGICGGNCQFCADMPQPEGRRTYPLQIHTPAGESRSLDMTTEPMQLEAGRQGILAVVRDDTRLHDLQVQLGERRDFHGMVGTSPAVREIFETIGTVATSDYPVLVTGESGTGKELAANAIHQESGRNGGPFVPVNCGALPEHILESELFGHVRGAFTGAINARKGRFELANAGTLFLDEVGEMPLHLQVKLLRVLQEGCFERVGGEATVRVDVRIISATNRDLMEMVRQGTFREDLYYRLCVVPLHLPPLRRRQQDIPQLVDHFLERIRRETGKQIAGVAADALDVLLAHPWPGNIRQLINSLQFAAVRCRTDLIALDNLPPELRRMTGADSLQPADPAVGQTASSSGQTVWNLSPPNAVAPPPSGRRRLTPERVAEALAATGGNKVQAARLLGVGRATLYRFFKKQDETR